MSALTVNITLSGVSETEMALQAVCNALAHRGPMHARMATRSKEYTQDYLRKLSRHDSAERLGANPTRHHQKAAASVEAQFDDNEGRVEIPRRTGLGRAFGDVILRPGSGRTYLTIPACQETYGRVAKSFGPDAFRFAMFRGHRPMAALLWKADGGRHKKGDVAYWLRTEVIQKQDRTLLPSDEGYAGEARRAAIEYLDNLIRNPNGTRGGSSSGMPSAT